LIIKGEDVDVKFPSLIIQVRGLRYKLMKLIGLARLVRVKKRRNVKRIPLISLRGDYLSRSYKRRYQKDNAYN